ncbi:Adk1 [Trypoxylus dichotomus]
MAGRRVCRKCHEHLVERTPINVPVIWVIGGPGSGKGTQCDRIAEEYGFDHISTGHLLSRQMSNRSNRSAVLLDIVGSGKLVPDEVMMDYLKVEIYKSLQTAKGIIIDGFPCTKKQGILCEKMIGPPDIIFFLDAPLKVLTSRILNRARESGRIDDNEDSAHNRIQIYEDYKDDLLQEFKSKLQLIDADRTPDEVFYDIKLHLSKLVE